MKTINGRFLETVYQSESPLTVSQIVAQSGLQRSQVHNVGTRLKGLIIRKGVDGDIVFYLHEKAREAYKAQLEAGGDLSAAMLFHKTGIPQPESHTPKSRKQHPQTAETRRVTQLRVPELKAVEEVKPQEMEPVIEDAVAALSKLAKRSEHYRQTLIKIKTLIDEALFLTQ